MKVSVKFDKEVGVGVGGGGGAESVMEFRPFSVLLLSSHTFFSPVS